MFYDLKRQSIIPRLSFRGNKQKHLQMEKLWEITQHVWCNYVLFPDSLTPLVLSTQPKLLSVNMSNNVISEIQPGAFTNMTRLVRLILSKNKITKLDQNSLSGGEIIYNLVKWRSIILSRCFQSCWTGTLQQLPGVHPHSGLVLTEEPQVSQFGLQQNTGE